MPTSCVSFAATAVSRVATVLDEGGAGEAATTWMDVSDATTIGSPDEGFFEVRRWSA